MSKTNLLSILISLSMTLSACGGSAGYETDSTEKLMPVSTAIPGASVTPIVIATGRCSAINSRTVAGTFSGD